MTTEIPVGKAVTMVQDQVYALPARADLITVITASGVISVSIDNSTYVPITLDTNFNFQTAALFIKSTTGSSVICCKLI